MFKKKNKQHSEVISYNVEKYNTAQNIWLREKPKIKKELLINTIVSDVEKGSLLYLSWFWEIKEFSIHAVSEIDDELFEYFVKVKTYFVEQLLSELSRFVSNNTFQVGSILDGWTEYYTRSNDWIEKGVVVCQDNTDVEISWNDYTQDPLFQLKQRYSYSNLETLIYNLTQFVNICKTYEEEYKEWTNNAPKTWMFPPEREEEDV